jgi:ABC-type bacteriocin/lantibiotic exporter with double-glycine peptidase domain
MLDKFARIKDMVSVFRNTYRYLPHKTGYILLMLIFASNSFIFNYIFAVVLRDIVTIVIDGTYEIQQVIMRFLLTFSIYLIILGVTILGSNSMVLNVEKNINLQFASAYLKRNYLIDMHSGDAMSRLDIDMYNLISILNGSFLSLMMPIISGVGGMIVIFSINYIMGMFCVGLGVITLMAHVILNKPLKTKNEKIQRIHGILSSLLTDVVAGGLIIRSYESQHMMKDKFMKYATDIKDTAFDRIKVEVIQAIIGTFSGFVSYVGIILFGYIFLANNQIGLPELLMVPTLSSGVVLMFVNVGSEWASLEKNIPGAKRVIDALNIEEENRNESGIVINENEIGIPSLTIKNMDFQYDSDHDSKKVLNDISLDIKPGEIVMICGVSGSGKTTFVNLLTGIIELQKGDISIDKYSIHQVKRSCWRKLFAYVPQNSELLSRTFLENITMGRHPYNLDKLREITKSVKIDAFIQKLPNGYNEDIINNGNNMSGGQKQKVAIARALYSNAPILILDEPVSSQDEDSKKQLSEILKSQKGKKTIILITHLPFINDLIDSKYTIKDGSMFVNIK